MEERVLELVPSAVMLRAEWMYDYVSPKPNYFLNVLHASQQVSFSSSQYRVGVAWQNNCYNQPCYTKFYLADDMEWKYVLPALAATAACQDDCEVQR